MNPYNSRMYVIDGILKRIGVLYVIQFALDAIRIQASTKWYTFDDSPVRGNFLTDPVPRFSDFHQILMYSNSSDPYTFAASGYPPFGNLVLAPLTLIDSYASFMLFIGVTLSGFLALLFSAAHVDKKGDAPLKRVGLLILMFPVVFAVERGNLDLLIVLLLGMAVLLNERGWKLIPAVLVGVAIAIKIYPIIILLCFLHKEHRSRFVAIATVTAASLTSFALYVYGLFSLEGIQLVLGKLFPDVNGKQPDSLGGWSTSITGFDVALRSATSGIEGVLPLENLLRLIPIALTVFVGAALFFVVLFSRKSIDVLAMCVFAMMLLPAVSFHYKAALLLLPIVLMLERGEAEFFSNTKVLWTYVIAIGPCVWWFFGEGKANISSLITPLCLIVLSLVVVRRTLDQRTSSKREKSTAADLFT